MGQTSFLLKLIEEKERKKKQEEQRGLGKEKFELGEVELSSVSKISDGEKFLRALSPEQKIIIIAEVKKASPSAGKIKDAEAVEQAKIYERGGADAISLLTEEIYFGGSKDDLFKVAKSVNLPVLRKDFIIYEDEIYETKKLGASSILLISEALEHKKLEEFIKITQSLNLEPLVECFSEEGMEKIINLKKQPKIIGINSRNLHTLEVDLNRIKEIYRKFRNFLKNKIVVAESGIKTKEDIISIAKEGITRFLIGETLMKSKNPDETIKEFKSAI
ncbi:MAG: indole-3-glycerol-phosphate synthase [Candidatus Calescibacterium sp.]|jgi:indole-3-glycerol phosphate synthase|nr:indole-3-glycerol-phosphate synthase [Candidatus Calescibacterium sp.]